MYDQFYGFTGRPFQLTPDPQFYFESATHRKALSYLGYGLAQGEGFIVITGEVGSGKSTLVGHLMQTIDRARLTAANIVTSQLEANDLLHLTAESFGIATSGFDKASTLKAIENHLHSEARAGRRCLLIVDEAQNLAVDALEELRMLSNFQLGSQPLLQIFLLGQPEFRDLVHSSPELEQLRQRIIATHHLDAMEADEVEPYLVHRLSQVGWTGSPEISAEACAAIYRDTGGIPRKINTLMSRVLLMGSIEEAHVIDDVLIAAVIADIAGKPFEYTAPTQVNEAIQEEHAQEVEVSENLEENQNDLPNGIGFSVPSFDDNDAAPAEEVSAPHADILHAELEQAAHSDDDVNFDSTDHDTQNDEAHLAAQHYVAEAQSAFKNSDEFAHVAPQLYEEKIAALELRVSEQEQSLRRVLAMMIDFMDREQDMLENKINAAKAA